MISSKSSWFDIFFKKTVPQREKNSDQEQTMQDMMIWLRKMEQGTESISTRLAAVEQRLSLKTRLSHPQWYANSEKKEKQSHSCTSSSEVKNVLHLNENEYAEELATVQDLLAEQGNKIASLENKTVNSKTNEITTQQRLDQLNEHLKNIQNTVDSIQKRQSKRSFSMKVKGQEIPIEISGIIGGVLAFIIAVLIGLGGKNVVVSPVFLAGIGCILIASSLFRSVTVTTLVKQWLTKSSQPDSKNDY
ncbi:MAG: hypothetical protein R6U21_04620 [Thermoplasmatota archaeon]